MKRWPIIRHVRCLYLSWRVHQWAHSWGQIGVGLGVPSDADLDHLDRIWRGEA